MLATEMQSPKTMPWPMFQPQSQAEADAEQGREQDLAQSARHDHSAHGEQVGSREMQADAEHQENDADLGELPRHSRIGHETRA